MKVTIDTQHDSVEDIHKVYQILADILQRKNSDKNSEAPPTAAPVDTSNLMSMFDTSEPSKSVPEKAPDFSSFLNLTKQTEKKEEKFEIEYY